MGGARCSYRTCTTKSDQKTHLFHFPVFDKTRCHRWITNAQKLNFLDLKLSQLRNRTICEHHFTDECFMNVTKGKLKNNAVPTEDGPFCIKLATENDECQIPINLDDIEEDYLTNMEKKAHFSVKYGDFLINDVTEPMQTKMKNIDMGIPNYKTTSIKLQDKCLIFHRRNSKYGLDKPQNTPCNSVNNNSNDIKEIDIVDNEKITIPNPVSSILGHSKPLPSPKVVAIEFEELNLTKQDNNSDKESVPTGPVQNFGQSFIFPTHTVNANSLIKIRTEPQLGQPTALPSHKVKPNKRSIPSSKKVKILSEESFPPLPKASIKPIKVKGEFQTVSPSLHLVPDSKKSCNVLINGTEIETLYFKMVSTEQAGNSQEINHSSILSQPIATNQVCNINELDDNTPSLVNQFEGSTNLQVQNELLQAKQPVDANYISSDIKTEPELLPDMQNVSIVSNVDCVSASANQPSVFTLLDVPIQDTRLLTGSTYAVPNVTIAPTDIQNAAMLLSTDTAISSAPVGNNKYSSSASTNSQNTSEVCQNMQNTDLNKKQSILQSSPNKTVLKNRLPPEKLAAIEEKRKFNTKLKSILNSCLNSENEGPDANKLSAAIKRKLADKKVAQHLSEDSTLPTNQENNIAYLEARLQRMEDTLLNKIDQNSARISDLKRTLKPSSGKKSAYTQTYFNAETAKKHMYQQISQYLSPETKSIVYEELFINSCIDNSSNERPYKKRKNR